MIVSPLRLLVGKKFFVLNLNIYRNTHYQILNKAKANYKELIQKQLEGLSIEPPVSITYIYYPPDNRRSDLGNVLPVHAKFFEDALVEYGCLPDDNYRIINKVTFEFGSVDKDNPRVEIFIKENHAIPT